MTAHPILTQVDAHIASLKLDSNSNGWRTSLQAPPDFELPADANIHWVLNTNKGEIKVKLWQSIAPKHVGSTVFLTRAGFYDGLAFHRVISDFMAQGGCPLGTGTGGPGYKYGGEFDPSAKHDRPGLLSMANAGPGTDGSQFFLTFVATPWLDGKHTLFGEVVEGMDNLRALEAAGSQSGTPKEPMSIQTATIEIS
ncbi:MAG: hypothetical protein DHS20C15_23410 [Planctomycetota bacterium]|nr:MAG: hypothetical protein DHS20C15_23410 [Planctomycetota bacterium]